MKEIKVIIVFILISQMNLYAKGWKPWPKIEDIVVKASVTVEDSGCEYSYCVYNSTKNSLGLDTFVLDLRISGPEHPFSASDLTTSHTLVEHIRILDQAEVYNIYNVRSPKGWGGKGGSWQIPNLVIRKFRI